MASLSLYLCERSSCPTSPNTPSSSPLTFDGERSMTTPRKPPKDLTLEEIRALLEKGGFLDAARSVHAWSQHSQPALNPHTPFEPKTDAARNNKAFLKFMKHVL